MSLQHEAEQVANSSLGASEETSKLLVEAQNGNNNNNTKNNANIAKLQKAQSYSCSTNGPTTSSGLVTQQSLSGGATNKPVLIRQDRTSSYLTSPQLSTLGTSEETSEEENARAISYQLMPNIPTNRCQTCRTHERRSSVSPSSVIYLPRSLSKESVGRLNPNSAVHHHSATIPPVFVTGSPTSSRIIRQSSQPEASSLSCCNGASCSHAHQTSSLRQLKDPSDQISGIAADALRVSFTLKLSELSEIYSNLFDRSTDLPYDRLNR